MRTKLVTVLAAAGLLFAACGTDEPPTEAAGLEEPAAAASPDDRAPEDAEELLADATTSIQVMGTDDLTFAPDRFVVPAGQAITVELTSGPGTVHNFGVAETSDIIVPHHEPGAGPPPGLAPGETATGTFSIDEPGTDTVLCIIDDHHNLGMVAELVVVDLDG